MEIREFSRQVLRATTLAGKLARPATGLTDEYPGTPERIAAPGRPPELTILPGRRVKVPPVAGIADPAQRARILHALANHELQAIELFAWAALAFPDAPPNFRRGLMMILAEEQRHLGMYMERLQALGVRFGDYPVTGHFWNKLRHVRTPLQFVCTMGLTFENANLDFAQEYAHAAHDAGDTATAAVLDKVHADEIRHVRFAWHWLTRFMAEGADTWTTYLENVAWPLGPARARGRHFDRESRVAAGLEDAFIRELEVTRPTRPSGRPR